MKKAYVPFYLFFFFSIKHIHQCTITSSYKSIEAQAHTSSMSQVNGVSCFYVFFFIYLFVL